MTALTPAEIAAKLTPAQVRALRDPKHAFIGGLFFFTNTDETTGHRTRINLFDLSELDRAGLTSLGRAVLAVLDGGKQ